MPSRARLFRIRRGSLLIVAMLLCAIIGISLVSYIQLGRTALNISNRALYNNGAVNLAEEGIEEAMYSVNQYVAASTYAWPGWTIDGSNAKQRWTGVRLSQNATAEYRVYLYNYLGVSAPKVVSRATVTLGNGGAPIEKWIEVTLNKTSKFANGLVAKNSITFNGNNATVDSWNSEKNPDGSARATPVPFSASERRDNGTVGSISIASDAVLVKQADVWGYVSNNSGSDLHPPDEFVGTNGSILGANSVPDATWTNSNIDPTRTSTTFSATIDAVTVPTTVGIANLGNINSSLTLPRATDTIPNGTGDYAGYYVYDASKIALSSGDTLTISGKVVLRVSSTVDTTSGSAKISIGANGYLSLYATGKVDLEGQGVANGVDGPDAGTDVDQTSELGQPKKFQLWGTGGTSQTIKIAGSGLFSGVVYAPDASVTITGNGAVCGSVVANSITLGGNAQFHYDESLADLGGGSPFRVSKWKELTSADDRAAYSSVMNW